MNKESIVYKNPLVMERADPWVYKHSDGYYYFTGSVPGYQEIEIRKGKTLNDLENGERIIPWKAHDEGPLSKLIWAPEIHFLNGKWYIYFAASNSDTIRNEKYHHRMFVLENSSADPFKGEWIEKGEVKTHIESFSLDATVFKHKDIMYYVWAQKDPVIQGNSNLYISKMENPWTLKGSPTLLTIPEYKWEKIGYSVNEGPAVLIRNSKIFITYSASATDHNYAMGMLWADADSNLLNKDSWIKSKEPIFKSSDKNSQYGPGHNSFTRSEDDKYDILVYHARSYKEVDGDSLNNPDRHARAKIFEFNHEEIPIFGEPLPDTN